MNFSIVSAAAIAGLAFIIKDIVGNLFAGLFLKFSSDIKKGDWIKVKGFEGTIIKIGWRNFSVKLSDKDEIVLIQNDSVFKEDVVRWVRKSDSKGLKKIGCNTKRR